MEDGGVELRRGKRRRLTTNAINKQKRLAKLAGISPAHKHNGQDHRFAKMHALNCGIPSCPMCGNPRKVWGELTIQEKKFMQTYPGEWLDE